LRDSCNFIEDVGALKVLKDGMACTGGTFGLPPAGVEVLDDTK